MKKLLSSKRAQIITVLLLLNEIRGAVFVIGYLSSTGGQLILPF